MNKKAVRMGIAFGIFLGTTIVVYAITSFFFTNSETSRLSKKDCVSIRPYNWYGSNRSRTG